MKKSNLDEMQEQKLLKIEHNCCWLAFWGLLAAIIVQAATVMDMRIVAGEFILFLGISAYFLFSCLRNGIWDRKLKPDLKTNFIGSLIAGVFIGLFSFVRFAHQITDPNRLFIACFLPCILVFIGCFGLLSITAYIHKKRREKLDQE